MSVRARDRAAVVEATVGVPPTEGNRVTVLRNGDEIFPAMIEAIEAAEQSVVLSTYVYWQGDIARRVADALVERARAGVDVRVLVDWVGGIQMDRDLVKHMEEHGVDFAWFRPPGRLLQSLVSIRDEWTGQHRTHRKVLVVDGRVGFTGGVGIADEWGGDARTPEEWRDTHVRIDGPAAHALLSAFSTNWHEATGERVPLTPGSRPEPAEDGSAVQVVRGQPGRFVSDVALVLRALLAEAETRIWIASAYFLPDGSLRELLCDAVARGVDVQVVVPGPHVDKRVSRLAARSEFEPLLRSGVTIHEFQPTMFHCKTVVVDDVAVVGSANCNMRSAYQDDEVVAVLHGEDAVRRLASDFMDDVRRSQRMDPDRFEQRSVTQRAAENATRVLRRFL